MMHVPSFFGYEHLQSAFLASKAAPYLYAPVPHAASAGTMRRLWSLEHRYGLHPVPPPSDDRSLRYRRKTAALPWTGVAGEELLRFIDRCENGLRFTFVRNPYQRLLSVYRTHIAADTVVGRGFRHAAGLPPTEEMDFERFVGVLGSLPEHKRHQVFAAQSDWLLTDFIPFHMIGAVERYATDYAAIAARLAAPGAVVEEPGGQDRPLCSEAAQATIQNLYGRDFSTFGYDTSLSAAAEPPTFPVERTVDRSVFQTPFWMLVDSRVQLQQGNHATAIRQIESVITTGEDGAVPCLLPALRLDLARIHLAAGDLGAAEAVLYTSDAEGPVTVESAAMLGEIAMRRFDPEQAYQALYRGLGCGLPDAPYLRELGSLCAMLGGLEAAQEASRTVTTLVPPGGMRTRLLDALIDGLDRPGSTELAMAVLDTLAEVDGLGYDAAGKAAGLGQQAKEGGRRAVAVHAPTGSGAPPEAVVAVTELRRLVEETTIEIESLRQSLVRAVLQTYPSLFDAEHYRQSWLEAARSELSPLEHYIRYGSRDMGREPNPLFSHACYTYHMLRKPLEQLDPLVHYVVKGAPDGIDPGPDFNTERYLEQWPTLQGSDANPLNDYLARGGSKSGYFGFMPESVHSELKALSLHDHTLFPHAHLIYCGKAGDPGAERIRRQGAAYSKLDRDLADSFSHLVLLPWVAHPGGAERVSAYVLHLFADEIGADKVVAIGTDRPSKSGFAMPSGIRLASLCDYDDGLTPDEMIEILERLILERKPKVTFIQNSYIGWLLLARRAKDLHSETSFYAFLFGYHFNDRYGVVGFHLHLPTSLPYLTGLITDNTRFPKALPMITPMLSEHAAKIFTIYTPAAPELTFQAPAPARKQRQGLWMSRFSQEKRMDVLGLIAEATPDRRYVVYGSQLPFATPVDISFLEDLPNVALRGYFRDLNDIPFGDCDAFVYTSDFDGLPLVLMEATAMGLPVIAPDVGGISDFITAETGWLVSGPDAVDEYVAALREIETRPDLVQKKVEAAQNLLSTRHGWEDFRTQYQNIPGIFSSVQEISRSDDLGFDMESSVSEVDFNVISLGISCQSTYQARRWLKLNEPIPLEWIGAESERTPENYVPYPFDWLVTPLPALLRALDTKFKDFMLKENLTYVPDVYPYIRDEYYNIIYLHLFPTTENFIEDYDKVFRKFSRALHNFEKSLASGKKVLFIRQLGTETGDAGDLVQSLRNAYPDLDFVLLWASSDEDERIEGNVIYRCITVDPSNWQGRDDLWDEALNEARRVLCS